MNIPNTIIRKRLTFLYIGVIAVFCIYFAYLFNIQIIRGYLHTERARLTSRRFEKIETIRGNIYDRNGHILAGNQVRYAVELVPSLIDQESLPLLISQLSSTLAIPYGEIEEKVQNYNPSRPSNIEIGDKFVLSDIMYLVEHGEEFTGVTWYPKNYRYYSEESRLAHVIGYVGQISAQELEVLPGQEYDIASVVGKSGIEQQYDSELKGRGGGRFYRVDAFGNEISTEEIIDPIPGNELVLTIDKNIQNLVWDALGNRVGTGIVLKPATGEILAMVSNPSFDPNLFYTKNSRLVFNDISLHPHAPFLNRAIQSAYPPASTFKVIMTTAIIEEQVFDIAGTVHCKGYYELGDRILYDWEPAGFGFLNIFQGLALSSNVFFWTLGLEHLGLDNIIDYSLRFGFGKKTGIDLPNETTGNVPSPEWKINLFKERWTAGDTANVSIGQGFITTTPIQVANMAAFVVNGGKVFRPYVVKEVKDKITGAIIATNTPELIREIDLNANTIAQVKAAMHGVIEFGTANSVITTPVVKVAGKTGTGQVSHRTDRFDSWFVAYAPADSPPEDQVVVVVFIEASNEWEWWAPKAANIIIHGIFTNTQYSEAVASLRKTGGLWYL